MIGGCGGRPSRPARSRVGPAPERSEARRRGTARARSNSALHPFEGPRTPRVTASARLEAARPLNHQQWFTNIDRLRFREQIVTVSDLCVKDIVSEIQTEIISISEGHFFGADRTLLKGWESKDVVGSCRAGRPSLNPAVKPLGRQSLLRRTPGQVGDASGLGSWRSRGLAAAPEQVSGDRRPPRRGPFPIRDHGQDLDPVQQAARSFAPRPLRGPRGRPVAAGGSGGPSSRPLAARPAAYLPVASSGLPGEWAAG
jgi:hypothetical protein